MSGIKTGDPNAYDITGAMIQMGGGFVRGLGHLYRQADEDNQRRLATAFPEYFEKYRVLALLPAAPQETPSDISNHTWNLIKTALADMPVEDRQAQLEWLAAPQETK
jgi:hypothetical protein